MSNILTGKRFNELHKNKKFVKLTNDCKFKHVEGSYFVTIHINRHDGIWESGGIFFLRT